MNEELQTTEEVTEQTEEVTPQADPEIETPQTPVEEEQPQQEPQEPDYKTKFKESAREGILQHERLKQKDAQIAQLTNKDTPTDEEMSSLYTNWNELDEGSKTYYRNQWQLEKRTANAERAAATLAQRLEFDDKLDDFVENPGDYKGLKGKEAEFKRFAKRKDNIGLPLDVLAKAYLFDIQEDTPHEHTPTITPGLEKGSGGPRTAPKPKKLSGEQAQALRKNNFQEWKRLVLAGQIEEEF